MSAHLTPAEAAAQMGAAGLFIASLLPVLKVAALCGVGAVAAARVRYTPHRTPVSHINNARTCCTPDALHSLHCLCELASQGLLTLDGRRVLSTLVVNIFVPCLFIDKLGIGVGFAEAVRLW